jgi:hypothetical protein
MYCANTVHLNLTSHLCVPILVQCFLSRRFHVYFLMFPSVSIINYIYIYISTFEFVRPQNVKVLPWSQNVIAWYYVHMHVRKFEMNKCILMRYKWESFISFIDHMSANFELQWTTWITTLHEEPITGLLYLFQYTLVQIRKPSDRRHH